MVASLRNLSGETLKGSHIHEGARYHYRCRPIIFDDVAIDGDTLTVGNDVYEWDNNSSVGAGNIPITTGFSNTLQRAQSFADAFNANDKQGLKAINTGQTLGSGNVVLLVPKVVGKDFTSVSVSDNDADTDTSPGWINGHLTEGLNGPVIISRNPSTTEVNRAVMFFAFGFTVGYAEAFVRTSTGVRKAHDGALTINGNYVFLDNTGVTDFVATDQVTVIAGPN